MSNCDFPEAEYSESYFTGQRTLLFAHNFYIFFSVRGREEIGKADVHKNLFKN